MSSTIKLPLETDPKHTLFAQNSKVALDILKIVPSISITSEEVTIQSKIVPSPPFNSILEGGLERLSNTIL
jgi:hypothetical protein